MKKILLIFSMFILVLSCKKIKHKDDDKLEREYQESIVDPSFERSENYVLTKLKHKSKNIDEEQVVHLKDKKGRKIFSFKVYAEDYRNNGGDVYEIRNPNLDNVDKVICILISQCFCGCSDEYHYIIKKKDGNYTSLPKLTSEGKDIYPVYTYRFGRLNTIEEVETTFKVEKNEVVIDEIMVVSKLVWDGEEVIND